MIRKMSEFGVQTKGTQKTRSLREIHSTLAEPLPFGLEIQLDIVTSSTVVSNTPEKNAGPLTATVVSNSPRKKKLGSFHCNRSLASLQKSDVSDGWLTRKPIS